MSNSLIWHFWRPSYIFTYRWGLECTVDGLVNGKLCCPTQLLLHHNGLVQHPSNCCRCTNAPVHLTLHSTLTRTPKYLNFFTLGSNSVPTQRKQSTVFQQRSMASHPERFTLKCKPPCWKSQSEAKEPHCLQRAEKQLWELTVLKQFFSLSWLHCSLLSQETCNSLYKLRIIQEAIKMWENNYCGQSPLIPPNQVIKSLLGVL